MHLPSPYKIEPSRISRNSYTLDGRDIRVAMRSDWPSMVLLENFLSKEECEGLIAQTDGRMQPSRIYTGVDEIVKISKDRKSLSGQWDREENELITTVENRILAITGFEKEQGELLHAAWYGKGGYVREHCDYFTLDTLPPTSHMAAGGWRVATFLVYLNDVEEGGETFFHTPRIKIRPRQGNAIYWEYCNSLGQMDEDSLHEALPLIEGEKWIITKIFRQGPFEQILQRPESTS